MRPSIKLFPLLLLVAIAASIAQAQSPSPTPVPLKHFKAVFVVKELDSTGRLVNSRSYNTILATTDRDSPNQIRSGDRIPLRVNTEGKGDIQYVDVGVLIDCRKVQEIDQKLAMSVKAEISSLPAGTDLNSTLDPLIRQFQWNADVILPPGVPTTIFSADGVSSKSKIELEVTATLIK